MTATRRMSLLEIVIVTLAVAAACAMPVATRPAGTPALEVVVGSASGDGLAFVPDSVSVPPATLIQVRFQNDSNQAHNLTFQAPLLRRDTHDRRGRRLGRGGAS